MNNFFRSDAGVRCTLILLLFLLLSVCLLLYESTGLISEFRVLAAEGVSGIPDPSAGSREGQFKERTGQIIQKRQKHFLLSFLVLLLGMTVFTLLFSLKNFIRTSEIEDDRDRSENERGFPDSSPEKNTGLSAEDKTAPEDPEENPDAFFNKMFDIMHQAEELERKAGKEELAEADLSEQIDIFEEEEAGALAHSYTKMVEALQKINELEKKHSVELANANELLENEIGERERAEKEIRYLSRKLISGIEEAQKKLAQDLHDEFGQTLAALHMGVENLWNTIPEHGEKQKNSFENLMDLIEQLGDRIRSISSDLRPDLLDDLGLSPTLDWYVKEFMEQRPDIRVEFQAIGFKKRMNSEFELILYRIFQESMNNVVKHSKAKNVDVMLTYNYPKVILMVKDDGVGFEPSGRSKGIGLIGMRERVDSVKGSIEIRSEKGKGTSVRVSLPVSTEDAEIRQGDFPAVHSGEGKDFRNFPEVNIL